MAMGKKKGGVRREPKFDLSTPLSNLKLSLQDRIGPPDETLIKPKAEAPKKPAAKPAKKKAKSRGAIGGAIYKLVYWGAVVGIWAVIAVVGVLVWVGAHLPAIQSLEIPKRPPTIQIVGLDGSVLATRGEQAGANVALKELPPYLPKAFIAIEDRRFYDHYGVDPIGIARARWSPTSLHRGVSQGGSTLTQQLAKNLFLTQERTIARKLQELELALWLERKHSKNEILELYLNRVYFGSGAYGVEAAAQRYFGKSAKNVTRGGSRDAGGPRQIAVAAGAEPQSGRRRQRAPRPCWRRWRMPASSPTRRRRAASAHPLLHGEAARRRHAQLRRRLDRRSARRSGRPDRPGHRGRDLDRSEAAERGGSRDHRRTRRQEREVQRHAGRAGGDDAGRRGARHDRRAQLCRQPVQPRGHRQAAARLGVQAVRLSHRDRSRADAGDDPAGRAARRQGLEAGELHPRIFRRGDADAGAGDVAEHGGGAARAWKSGAKNVVRTAHRLGIASKLEANASIALGTSEVSLTELVGAYAPFANGGLGVSPHVVEQDQDRAGQAALLPATTTRPPRWSIRARWR